MSSVNKIVEVNAPGLEEDQVRSSVEKRARQVRDSMSDEIQRVQDLDFSPDNKDRMSGFNPSRTTNLFEGQVSPPDFSSSKYKYLPRVFRRLASRIFPVFAVLYDKLSEKKIQAFYDVVHELMAINHRYNKLHQEFQELLKENIKLQTLMTEAVEDNQGKLTDSSGYINIMSLPEALIACNERSVNHLLPLSHGNILVVDDNWGEFASLLKQKDFRNISVSLASLENQKFIKSISDIKVIPGTAAVALAVIPEESLDAVAIPDISRISGRPEYFFDNLSSRLKSGGILFIRYISTVKDSPFHVRNGWDITLSEMREYCISRGFIVEEEDAPDELAEGSFELYMSLRS